MKTPRALAFLLLVALGSVARSADAAPPLSESLSGEAKVDFEAARVLFEDGDFPGAALKFQQAYERAKDPRLLWNVAVCEKAQRHYVRVMRTVERYLVEGKDTLAPEQVKTAEGVLEAIKPFIGTVKVESESDVRVAIDGEAASGSIIFVDQGKHQLTAQKEGFRPFTTSVSVDGGKETVVPIALVRIDLRARIAVHASEGDSIVFDDKVVGVTRWQSEVNAGSHSLRVSAPKHKAYELQLDLAEGSTRTVEVTLENEARPLWPFIAGGVVLVGAAVIGGYFLFKPDAKPGDQPAGSLSPGLVNLSSVLR